MIDIAFGGWEPSVHAEFKQIKRISSSMDKKLEKELVSLDLDEPRALIHGSGVEPYEVTLSSCTCQDFTMNQKGKAPCKHIYFLARKAGLMDNLPVYDPSSGAFDPAAEFEAYRCRYEHGDIPLSAYVAIGDALQKLIK